MKLAVHPLNPQANGVREIYIPNPDINDDRNDIISDEIWNPNKEPYLLITVQGTFQNYQSFLRTLVDSIGIRLMLKDDDAKVKAHSGPDGGLYLAVIIGKEEVLRYIQAASTHEGMLNIADEEARTQLLQYGSSLLSQLKWAAIKQQSDNNNNNSADTTVSSQNQQSSNAEINYPKLRTGFIKLHGYDLSSEDLKNSQEQVLGSNLKGLIDQNAYKQIEKSNILRLENKDDFNELYPNVSIYVEAVFNRTKIENPKHDAQQKVLLGALLSYLYYELADKSVIQSGVKDTKTLLLNLQKILLAKFKGKEEFEQFEQNYESCMDNALSFLSNLTDPQDAIVKSCIEQPWQEAVNAKIELMPTRPQLEDIQGNNNNNDTSFKR